MISMVFKKFPNITKSYFLKILKIIHVKSKMPFNRDCSYHLYWIIVKNRNGFIKKMRDKGI